MQSLRSPRFPNARLQRASYFGVIVHSFIEYLLQSPNEALRNKLLPGLLAGSRAGATGLSNAMKFLSGIEGLQIKASKIDGALRIDGQLPWVTNLRSSGFDVAAAVQGDGNSPAVVASSDDVGLQRSSDLDLMAMRATSTAAIKIDNVRISADRILHHDASEWLPKVRPAFLGLQCAMAIGLARRSIRQAESRTRYSEIICRSSRKRFGESRSATARRSAEREVRRDCSCCAFASPKSRRKPCSLNFRLPAARPICCSPVKAFNVACGKLRSFRSSRRVWCS
jgi:alkylation response protein AidB-like acyl-CoA dehydrogenase